MVWSAKVGWDWEVDTRTLDFRGYLKPGCKTGKVFKKSVKHSIVAKQSWNADASCSVLVSQLPVQFFHKVVQFQLTAESHLPVQSAALHSEHLQGREKFLPADRKPTWKKNVPLPELLCKRKALLVPLWLCWAGRSTAALLTLTGPSGMWASGGFRYRVRQPSELKELWAGTVDV